MEAQARQNLKTLTSMKVSMLSIRAWARPMMNWFTHAIAWDLRGRQTSGIYKDGFNREILMVPVYRLNGVKKQKTGVSLTWSWGCSVWKTVGTWGSWCSEVCSEHRYPTTLMSPRRSSAMLQKNPERKIKSGRNDIKKTKETDIYLYILKLCVCLCGYVKLTSQVL